MGQRPAGRRTYCAMLVCSAARFSSVLDCLSVLCSIAGLASAGAGAAVSSALSVETVFSGAVTFVPAAAAAAAAEAGLSCGLLADGDMPGVVSRAGAAGWIGFNNLFGCCMPA